MWVLTKSITEAKYFSFYFLFKNFVPKYIVFI